MNLHKLYIPIIAGVVLVLTYSIWSWFGEHDNRVRAEEQDKASKAIIAQKDADKLARDQAQAASDAKIDKLMATLTAKQAQTVLAPIVVPQGQAAPPQITKGELPQQMQATLPNVPANTNFTLFTDQQMVDLGKFKLGCDKTTGQLTTCQQDLADETDKFIAMQKERDTWEKAAKGGSWLKRTLRVALPVSCAVGGAYLGGSHSGGKGAAFGAVAGAIPCSFVIH